MNAFRAASRFKPRMLSSSCCHTLERCSTPTLHYLSTACAHDRRDNWTHFPTEVWFLSIICAHPAAFMNPLSEMFPSGIWVRPGALFSVYFISFQIVMVLPASPAHALLIIIILTWSLSWLLHRLSHFPVQYLFCTSACHFMFFLYGCGLFGGIIFVHLGFFLLSQSSLSPPLFCTLFHWNIVATSIQLSFLHVNWHQRASSSLAPV